MKRIVLGITIAFMIQSAPYSIAAPLYTPPGPFVYTTARNEAGAQKVDLFTLYNNSGNVALITSNVFSVLSNRPLCIRITPDNKYAYVTTGLNASPSSTMLFADLSTNVSSSFIMAPANFWIAITPDGTYGYTTTRSNVLNAFSIPGNTLYPSVITLSYITKSNYLAIAPNQQYLLVTDSTSNNVEIVDITAPTTPTTIGHFTVGSGINNGVAIASNSSTAYIVDGTSNMVYPVTGLPSSPTLGSPISVLGGGKALSIALAKDNATAYIGNKNTLPSSFGYITVINNINTLPATMLLSSSDTEDVLDLAITSDDAYLAVPTPAGLTRITTATNAIDNAGTLPYYSAALTTPPNPPAYAQGCAIPLLNDFVNVLTWSTSPGLVVPIQYNIYSDPGLTNLLAVVPASAPLTYQFTNLTPGITYTYYIVALDFLGDVSAPAIVTIDPSYTCYPNVFPPSSIEGCFITVGYTVTNVISWTPPSSGATPSEYQIFYDAGLTQLVATVPAYVLSYEDTGLSTTQTYSYYVISVDEYGDVSDPISITITDPCYPAPYVQPDPPTNVIGKRKCNLFLDKTERILNLNWTASITTNIASYNIYNGTTLVRNSLATKPLCFVTRLFGCDNGNNFSITAVDSNGIESAHTPATVM